MSNHLPGRQPCISKIHWELNWLNQRNPRLIKFLRDEVLIPPPVLIEKVNLKDEIDENQPWKHQGQNGEAVVVEYIYGLRKTNLNLGG